MTTWLAINLAVYETQVYRKHHTVYINMWYITNREQKQKIVRSRFQTVSHHFMKKGYSYRKFYILIHDTQVTYQTENI